jgi:hypothetical protein
MPKRLRNLAGTMIAPRFPTLADSIIFSLCLNDRLYHLPDIQA